jgi:tripartite-type tricarboxylate transporter receptor subunit TctC
MSNVRRTVLALAAFIALMPNAFAAETYPAKPIRVVIGFPPGGFVDFTARLVSVPLGSALGQSVIVENRGGAGGIVGTEFVARAAPDGYTLTVGSAGTHAVNQSLYPKLPYNVLRDFQPIARLADAPSILAVHPSLPVKNVKELLALARAKPRELTYASAGSGTSTHLAAALFEHLGRVELVHIPFKGGGPAMVALLSGEVPITFGTAASVSPQTKAGKLRALGVTSGKRSTVLPEIPTIAEGGLPGYEMLNWLGLFAPTGTPRASVDRLASESLRVLQQPDVVQRFHAQGAEPSPLGTDELGAFVKKEIEKWAKVVAATGMKAD